MLLGKNFVDRIIFLKDVSYVRHQFKLRLVLSGYSVHSSLFYCWIKTPRARKLREEFIQAYTSRGIRVCGGRSWELASSTASTKQGKQTRTARVFKLSKSTPQWNTSSSKAIAPDPTQAVSPSGDQVFKCPEWWGTFTVQTIPMWQGEKIMIFSTGSYKLKTKTNRNKTLELK